MSETKERILDAAEGLFADGGFAATSLRSITAEAGVNLAAVNYHFGSKEALLRAVLERRFRPINGERLERLDALEREAGADAVEIERLVEAFVRPPLEKLRAWGEAGEKFIRLAGRLHAEPSGPHHEIFLRQFDEIVARFGAALRKALPDHDGTDVHWVFHFLVGSMAHVLIWARAPGCGPDRLPHDLDPDDMVDRLVRFIAAGMRAPAPRRAAAAPEETS